MSLSKIQYYLTSFSAIEFNRLSKFLNSPYFNSNKKIVQLIELLQEKPEVENDKIKLSKFFFNKTNELNKVRRLISDAIQLIEDFLTLESFVQNNIQFSISKIKALNQKQLNLYIHHPITFTEQYLKNKNESNLEIMEMNFQLNIQKANFLETKNLRSDDKNIHAALLSLDHLYFLQKLRLSAALLHYQLIIFEKFELKFLDECLGFIKNNFQDFPLLIQVYYFVVLSLQNPSDESSFECIQSILNKNNTLFGIEQARELYAFTVNYCVRKINLGEQKYQKIILDIYKEMLQNKTLMVDGKLSPWDFKNIITVAIRIKDFAWTENFVTQYCQFLPSEMQENARNFNMARYHYATGNHSKALQLLQLINYDDVFYMLDAKVTLFKIYYDLGEYESMMSLKESFRILLRRKKIISNQHRINYENFLKLATRLYRLDVRDKKKKIDLFKLIETTVNVADKGWLLERANQLKD